MYITYHISITMSFTGKVATAVKANMHVYSPPKLPKNNATFLDYAYLIGYERRWVDIKPYSENLISMYLEEVSRCFGDEEANNIIDLVGLEELGWEKI